jgi:hypothetical protein
VKRATLAKGDKTPVESSAGPSAAAAGALLFSSAVDQADRSSAGHSGREALSHPFPLLQGSDQIAVESDAEAGFTAGSERFFKKSKEQTRAHRRAASQGLSQIQTTNSRQPSLPEIIVQANSPEDHRISPSASFSGTSSPLRRRRWGSSLYNAFAEPATAPLVDKPPEVEPQPTPLTADSRTQSFLSRFRSTSLTALASPFVRMGNPARDADTRSLTSVQLADERWSSESSSEDEFLWNSGQTAGASPFAVDIGDDENRAWGTRETRFRGSGHREEEDADLTAVDVPDSP